MKIWKRDYYEKLLARKPATDTVEHYQLQIKEAQRKIEELQAGCTHDSHEVVFYSWRPGALHPSHVCSRCNKHLGSATEEESKKLWDAYYSSSGAKTTTGVKTFIGKSVKNDD